MRKLYTFFTGLLFSLVMLKTAGQSNNNPQELFSGNTVSNQATINSDNSINSEINGIASVDTTTPVVTCTADFEETPTPNDYLYKKFTAIPWNSEQKRPVYICWKFGDGRDTCIQYSATFPGPYTIVHYYQQPGNYEVCVRIVYQDGCEAKKCKVIIAGETCKADFEKLLYTAPNNPLLVYYKALPWNSSNKKPKTICWSFGDGRDTCIQYPENFAGVYVVKHRYREPGVYNVCIKIHYYGGCEAGTCKIIRAGKRDECKADFERLPYNTTNNPLVVYYKALPWNSNNRKPKQICWSFGDGKDTCIEYPSTFTGSYVVRHNYREPGRYEVCVKILYYGGCEARTCKIIYVVRPDVCGADFERLPLQGTDPLVAAFKAIPSHNNHKLPRVICWSFGDGKDTCVEYAQTFTGSYVIYHHYKEPGTYNVCVKISYYGGCEARICKTIIVTRPDECKADFERVQPVAGAYPLAVYYKALPWNNNNKKPKVICWYFGDGKDTCIEYPETFTGTYYVRHLYQAPGHYQVCIKILYYGGCEAKNCREVILGEFCKADFEKIQANTTNNPLRVYYKALPWHSLDKKPKTICWSFGDGKDTCIDYPETFTGAYAISHEYREPGIYKVCIKILYYGGCEAHLCKEVTIGEFCKADFERIPVNSTEHPLLVYYKALPWHSLDKKPKTICWNFGDGKDTCIDYPETFTGVYAVSHEYREPGVYKVCIKIIYYGGCEAYLCKEVIIGEFCKADFERIPVNSTEHPLLVYYKALPWHSLDKKPKTICWNFGDGKDTCINYTEDYTGQYVIYHHYEKPGDYEVCIKILYFGGCEAKNCKIIKVEGIGECHVKLFELIPSINSLTRGFVAYPWSSDNKRPLRVCWWFGDGEDTCTEAYLNSTLPSLFIRHTYPAPGVYKACVKVVFDGGCIAYDCVEVVIRPTTDACGGYMTDSLVSLRTYKFKGYPIHNQDDPVVSFYWTFGDGSSASGNEVTHTYNVPGTYEVCLTIKTYRGCETHICKKLSVPGEVHPVLQISPNPVVTTMHVLFISSYTETVNIKIVNSFGVVVRTYVRNAMTGQNTWDFDLSTLAAGTYTLYVQSPNQLSSLLFIKVN